MTKRQAKRHIRSLRRIMNEYHRLPDMKYHNQDSNQFVVGNVCDFNALCRALNAKRTVTPITGGWIVHSFEYNGVVVQYHEEIEDFTI